MRYTTTFIALAAAFAPPVLGHGFLASVDIDGKTFKGINPDLFGSTGKQVDSAIRLVDMINPIKGTDNPAMNCGSNAKPGNQIAPANPGSIMAFNWSGGSSQHWPHKVGPVITYLAKCGDTTCDKFDSKDAKWFKIDQQGQTNPKDQSEWASGEFFKGKKLNVKIPEATPPGNYIVRHEIVALHVATTEGGAEFYPSCVQLKIGKGKGKSVQPSQTVSFPGAYKETDPGILVPSIFDPVKNYKFPGPVLSNVVKNTPNKSDVDEPEDENEELFEDSEDTEIGKRNFEETEDIDDEPEMEMRPRQISRVMAHYRRGNRNIFN